MVRMSTALTVVPRLGPGQPSLDSFLPGQRHRHSVFSCDGGGDAGSKDDALGFLSWWFVRAALAWPGLSPFLFGSDSDDRALAGAGA